MTELSRPRRILYKVIAWAMILATLLTVWIYGVALWEAIRIPVGPPTGQPITADAKGVTIAMLIIPLLMVTIIWVQGHLLYKFATKIVEDSPDEPEEGVTPRD